MYKNVEIVYAGLPICRFATAFQQRKKAHIAFSHGQHRRFRRMNVWIFTQSDTFYLWSLQFYSTFCSVDCCRLWPFHFSLLARWESFEADVCLFFTPSRFPHLFLRLQKFWKRFANEQKQSQTKTTTQKLDGISQWELNDSNQLENNGGDLFPPLVRIVFRILCVSVCAEWTQ